MDERRHELHRQVGVELAGNEGMVGIGNARSRGAVGRTGVVMVGSRKRREGGENAERLVVGLASVDSGLHAGDVAGRKLGLALGHLVEARAVMDTAQDEADRLPLDAHVVAVVVAAVQLLVHRGAVVLAAKDFKNGRNHGRVDGGRGVCARVRPGAVHLGMSRG